MYGIHVCVPKPLPCIMRQHAARFTCHLNRKLNPMALYLTASTTINNNNYWILLTSQYTSKIMTGWSLLHHFFSKFVLLQTSVNFHWLFTTIISLNTHTHTQKTSITWSYNNYKKGRKGVGWRKWVKTYIYYKKKSFVRSLSAVILFLKSGSRQRAAISSSGASW